MSNLWWLAKTKSSDPENGGRAFIAYAALLFRNP
jgi:hypothetical protein